MTNSTSGALYDPDDNLPYGGEAWCRAIMKEMSDEMAPRRFSLWRVRPDWKDAALVGWGYASDDETILDLPNDMFRLAPDTLDRMLKRLKLCAIWVDAELAPNTATV